jgi:acyl carrier protein
VGRGAALGRDDVLAMLTGLAARRVEDDREQLDSLELAWLLHQVEQRYGVPVNIDDRQLGRMATVSGAVEVLREVIGTA